MDHESSLALIEQWLTGPFSFATYWGILLAAAALEVLAPGRKDRMPSGPRFAVNFGFGLMTMLILTLPILSEIAFARLVRDNGWGLFNRSGTDPIWSIVLGFLAYDLCGYTIHRLSHRWPWLWRLHRVHHSDSDMDVSTYFRSHPLDVLVILAIKFALIASLGLHPASLALHGLAKQLTMTFGHANIQARPAVSRIISLLFVSPSFHQVHHSASRSETDSNYGEVLTLWDRLLGSVGRTTGTVERFGLGDRFDVDSASLLAQLRLPFVSR